MIKRDGNVFHLSTKHTSYIFAVGEADILFHLYYGRKIKLVEGKVDGLFQQSRFPSGNLNWYSDDNKNLCLEDECLEVSSYGKGDIREPYVTIVHEEGNITSDFVFESADISKGRKASLLLPSSYDENDEVEHLRVILKDRNYDIRLELNYYVYSENDVITRSSKIINNNAGEIEIKRLMSLMVDFFPETFVATTFNGSWAREMKKSSVELVAGKHINSTIAGTSSSRANPFVMLSHKDTSESKGSCYGFNLIYSGNHYECFEAVNGRVRFVNGINPEGFSYRLSQGESFEAPEGVMTFSDKGFNGMSHNLHDFVRENIVRGKFKTADHPILLNSWEAAYFDINEKKLLGLAKAAKDVGIELFVMDDGWFGDRADDTKALGDWYVNKSKFPDGLFGMVKKINDMGLQFGIWVEPEMVNVDSNLYKEHPDWAIDVPDMPHSEGRNQRILDLTRSEVCDYIIESMSNVLSQANISYVKWDMNRIFSDVFAKKLPANRQQEVNYRYYVGFYRCLRELREKFPDVLFEGCSAGGNRFDLGMLCYFDQIWASDNTDAICRSELVNNLSYGYPLCVMGSHVSASPNHQTLRKTSLNTRFNVALFGSLGYECNLCDMTKEELELIKEQVNLYKEYRGTINKGDFYRVRNNYDGGNNEGFSALGNYNGALSNVNNMLEWSVVDKTKENALCLLLQKLSIPNSPYACLNPRGLDEDKLYRITNKAMKINIKEFGDLVNTVSPIHIKNESFTQQIVSKFVKMDGESEDIVAYGDFLMNNGAKLLPGFAATGYSDQVRFFNDFASRLYTVIETK